MIRESGLWKEELLRIADALERRYNQKRWTERSLFLLEKELFVGFFILRKLIESSKISTVLTKEMVDVAVYQAGMKEITLLNQHRFPEFYDLYAGKTETLNYEHVSNQFIHSSIVAPFIPFGGSLVGVFIVSDRVMKKQIYYIALRKIIEIFISVGNDEPTKREVSFDESRKEYVISNS